MYLYINTASHKNVEISIVASNLKAADLVRFSCKYQFQIKDKLLKEIDKILVKNSIVLNNLSGIIAVNKSKEMTSLRIGVAVANALAYSLNIPTAVAGNKKFEPIKPRYEINPMLKKIKI